MVRSVGGQIMHRYRLVPAIAATIPPQAVTALRANPRVNGVLLIALTGWRQQRDLRRSREAGFDHHLVKPLNLERLRHALEFGRTTSVRAASRR